MMFTGYEIDTGRRCDRHVGEVFPPRCHDCGRLRAEGDDVPRCGFIPGSACTVHTGYVLPCPRCRLDAEEQS